jgi:hypothetical protein
VAFKPFKPFKTAWNAVTGQSSFKTKPVAGVYSGSYAGYEPLAAGMATQAGANYASGRQATLDTASRLQGISDYYATAPSYAEQAGQATLAQANSDAMSRAASARGANSALMMREQQAISGQQGRQAALDIGAMSAQEMAGRYGQRAQMLDSAAGIQSGVAGLDANRENAAAQRDAAMRADVTGSNTDLQALQAKIDMTNAANKQKFIGDTIQTFMGAGASGAAAGGGGGAAASGGAITSDVRAKTDIQPLGGGYERAQAQAERVAALDAIASDPRANRNALDGIEPYSYRYKAGPAARYGEDTQPRVGVMAQDIEKAGPAGAAVVSEDENGVKKLDVHRALGLSLAGVAGLDKRLARLEAAYGK